MNRLLRSAAVGLILEAVLAGIILALVLVLVALVRLDP
jgi:hypothetical protein